MFPSFNRSPKARLDPTDAPARRSLPRPAKYAIYLVALGGIAAGTLAWVGVDKSVTLEVDGNVSKVRTTAGHVSGALADAGYSIGAHDLVAPAASASVHNGSHIVLRRGRLLHLTVDGHAQNVWVTAPTVEDALSQLGYSTTAATSVSRDKRLPLGATDLQIRTPLKVAIRHDGTTSTVQTTAITVGAILDDLGLTVGPKDQLSVAASSAPHAGQTIVLRRVRQSTQVTTAPIPFPTTKQTDPSLAWGQTELVTPGRPGTKQTTYQVVYVDQTVTSRKPVSTRVVAVPVAAVVKVGTAAQTPDQAKAAAQQLVAARGWGGDQFSCLELLWNKESGWRSDAANPSGAYGIPQALPGDKMASVGSDWQTNAVTQITWGLNYIAGVYGTPCAAWGHSQATNWY